MLGDERRRAMCWAGMNDELKLALEVDDRGLCRSRTVVALMSIAVAEAPI